MIADPEALPAWRWVLILLLWLAIVSGLVAAGIDPILKGDLGDPDAYLQLVKASRIVETHDWYDSVLPRSNWPLGEVTTWSRSLDAALLSGAALLKPFLGFHDALFWFGAAFSPLCLLISAFAVGWMARPLLPEPGCFGASLLLLIQPGVLNYTAFSPNHHSLLFLAFIAACGFALRALDQPQLRWPAILAGITLALGFWTSVEFLLPLAVMLTAFGALWLFGGEGWVRLNRGFIGGFLVMLAALQPVERAPWRDMLTPEFDRMSIAHVLLAALLFAFWILVPAMVRRLGGQFWARFAAGTVGIIIAAAGMYAVYPKFFGGPLIDVNPALIPFLVTNNADWRPVLPTSFNGLAIFLVYLGVPVLCFFWIAWRLRAWRSDPKAPLWLLLFLLMLAYIVMTARSIRFGGYPGILCLIPLIDLVEDVYARLSRRQNWRTLFARAGAVTAIIIGLPVAGALVLSLAPPSNRTVMDTSSCRLADIAPVLNDPAGLGRRQQLILAEIHSGSEILYRTPHAVLATPMFRNLGILDTYHILAAPQDEDAHRIVEGRHVDLILLCPGSGERSVFSSSNHENTLYNRLIDGRLPGWIQPVALPNAAAAFYLFAVKP